MVRAGIWICESRFPTPMAERRYKHLQSSLASQLPAPPIMGGFACLPLDGLASLGQPGPLPPVPLAMWGLREKSNRIPTKVSGKTSSTSVFSSLSCLEFDVLLYWVNLTGWYNRGFYCCLAWRVVTLERQSGPAFPWFNTRAGNIELDALTLGACYHCGIMWVEKGPLRAMIGRLG